MSENRSYYAIIPANVRYDKRLPANAKLLYGEITALCNEKGFCWAGDKYFADLYGVSKVSIQKWLKALQENGYITKELIYKEGWI
ncbi:helix-turn-helix domain-containing protein [Enterococcus asini]|nr:helix-turn-helix domain-containing protein [Enterococcus asini]